MDEVEVDEATALMELGIKLLKSIGYGSYSRVKSAVWSTRGKEEPTKIAVKIINRATAPIVFKKKFLPRELKILRNLTHTNIIRMYDSFKIMNKTYLCLEFAGRGDLLDLIQVKGPLDELEARRIFTSICNGLTYLHNNNVVHRDLKCENIMMTSDNDVKIGDFGFAREMCEPELSRTFCGSAAYAAPEIIRGMSYDGKRADIWSIGVILFVMVCSIMPFRDHSRSALLEDQANALRYPDKLDKNISSTLKDLIAGILNYETSPRLRMKSIQNHDWMGLSGSERNLTMPGAAECKWVFKPVQPCSTSFVGSSYVTTSHDSTPPAENSAYQTTDC